MDHVEARIILAKFRKFLASNPDRYSEHTTRLYSATISSFLKDMAHEHLSVPEMIEYFRAGGNEGYYSVASPAWSAFRIFAAGEGVHLPAMRPRNTVKLVHPLEPHVRALITEFPSGVPWKTPWSEFVQTQTPKVQLRAYRCYEFFAKVSTVTPTQPIVSFGETDHTPMPEYVVDAILRSRKRRTATSSVVSFHLSIVEAAFETNATGHFLRDVTTLCQNGVEQIGRRAESARLECISECHRLLSGKEHAQALLCVEKLAGLKMSECIPVPFV